MFRTVVTACLLATVFLWGGAQVWSDDIEDRFINPDVDASKIIFIDVKDAALVNVLKIISQQSGLSFIASQDVADKKISVYLNKIPLDQALQTVLDANGLSYQMENNSNVFFVKAKETTAKNLITKVYQLKYATVSASPINTTISTSGAAGTITTGTSTGSSSGSSSGSSAGSASGSFSGGLEAVIKDALSPDGKVVEDTRTNSLIITDAPGQFASIDSAIARLDVPIPQILIEVEMLDVSKSTADQMGITYGATLMSFSGAQESTNFPFGLGRGIPSTTNGSSSSSSSSSSGSTSTQTGPITSGSFNSSSAGPTAVLNFLSTNNDSRTLARPRILTLNNQTAQIEISTDQAISVEPNSSTSSTNTVTTYTIERVTTGVVLKVTPQANLLTREITLAVSPKVISVNPSVLTTLTNPVYDPETEGSDSMLKLKDGQTMMIGGLMREDTENNKTKLPFLGDLPLIGAAFRSSNKTKNQRELIIFLTPHIIDDVSQSALKGDNTITSSAAAKELQDIADRHQEINDSLNSYEMKQY
jgi:type II secretory pathway component GspD/PulD (secretin)